MAASSVAAVEVPASDAAALNPLATNDSTAFGGAWRWVPSLYFAEGVPYVMVMTVAVAMFKRLGVSNTQITFYTSCLYLPWAIKPLWSPLVEGVATRRRWALWMQLLVAVGLSCTAMVIPTEHFLFYSLAALACIAFSSATHDVAADGYYMLALSSHEQAWFVGIRNIAYRLATLACQGPLVMAAGWLEVRMGSVPLGWASAFALVAAAFLLIGAYHAVMLPRPIADFPRRQETGVNDFGEAIGGWAIPFLAFLRKPRIGVLLFFLLSYRFAEAQLSKLQQPFLLDARDVGGLGLTTEQVGLVYGTVGVAMLMLGGLAGGFAAARDGLKRWLWPMALAIHLPNAAYLYLAYEQPTNLWVINAAVAVEQFGYGFGFTAYLLYCIYIARGEHETVHYALCTGCMALGMMIPGMWSGWLEELLGYQRFFIWIMLATIPSFLAVALIPLDARFGKKRAHV